MLGLDGIILYEKKRLKLRALPIVKDTDLYSWGMPNSWNISLNYYYVLILVLPAYVIIFPQLYSHMFRQVRLSSTRFLAYFEF